MAKKLNYLVSLLVDNTQAKKALLEVITDLNKLGSLTNMVTSLLLANSAAMELSKNLQSALNTNGTLDLSKFNDNLTKSGRTLTDYADELASLGSEGQEAFLKVAQSIMSAETPLKRSNKLLSELWTTMKNTARWQLSSAAVHTFTNALSSAYSYAQELNESLTNIRIVTGYSAELMASFAEQANEAAKALSTTTTEYSNASLIYYQLGKLLFTVMDGIV